MIVVHSLGHCFGNNVKALNFAFNCSTWQYNMSLKQNKLLGSHLVRSRASQLGFVNGGAELERKLGSAPFWEVTSKKKVIKIQSKQHRAREYSTKRAAKTSALSLFVIDTHNHLF